MHIWTLRKWEKYYTERRSGLRLIFDKDVDPEVRRACKEFAKWLRREYYFPIRVRVYIKAKKRIKAMDGDLLYGIFNRPFDYCDEPYVRIATGDYDDLLKEWGKDSALTAYIKDIAHELTHYFQWLNQLKLTEMGGERQAKQYETFIKEEYAETRDHP